MRTLQFLEPQFKKGLNYTVRLGDKWRQANPDEFVWIGSTGTGKSINSIAQIRKVIYCKLVEIPDEVLENEHDIRCHNWDGLIDAMELAYPDYFKGKTKEEVENTLVTCLGFYVYHADYHTDF